MNSNLIIAPKGHKLNLDEEILKNLKPYFQISSRGHSNSQHSRKLVEGKWIEEDTKDSKIQIDIVLRDSNSGELIAKGHFECNPDNENREKYEENVALKSITGQEIGTVTIEIAKPQEEKPRMSIEHEFRHMRRALGGMMRQANRMFKDFSRNFYDDDNFSFGMLDDWMRPELMLESENDWFPEFKLPSGGKNSPKNRRNELKESQSQQEKKVLEPEKKNSDKREMSTEEKKPEVEITEEKN